MKVNEVTGDVEGYNLPAPFKIIDVADHEPFDEHGALPQGLAPIAQVRPRWKDALLRDSGI